MSHIGLQRQYLNKFELWYDLKSCNGYMKSLQSEQEQHAVNVFFAISHDLKRKSKTNQKYQWKCDPVTQKIFSLSWKLIENLSNWGIGSGPSSVTRIWLTLLRSLKQVLKYALIGWECLESHCNGEHCRCEEDSGESTTHFEIRWILTKVALVVFDLRFRGIVPLIYTESNLASVTRNFSCFA